jgi:hypothetical protein
MLIVAFLKRAFYVAMMGLSIRKRNHALVQQRWLIARRRCGGPVDSIRATMRNAVAPIDTSGLSHYSRLTFRNPAAWVAVESEVMANEELCRQRVAIVGRGSSGTHVRTARRYV